MLSRLPRPARIMERIMDLPRRRLTFEEYQQQIALLQEIASASKEALRFLNALWNVPHTLSTILNALLRLDRLLFPQRVPWNEKVDGESNARRRVYHLTATDFWLKPCPGEVPSRLTFPPWQPLH